MAEDAVTLAEDRLVLRPGDTLVLRMAALVTMEMFQETVRQVE